jgi:serine/threonine protein kinase
LYFIQQYVHGGDLFELLHSSRLTTSKLGGLPLPQAAFYLANVLGILEVLHDEDVVLRDLKPENLVLDGKGYLKLVDLGSAKIVPIGCKTNTLCGCALYLAPEMILSKGYSRAVDFWALGILFFELLTRRTPFAHDNIVSQSSSPPNR